MILNQTGMATIVNLHSVDPRKLRVGVKYYIVHMYSMPYYTYGSTAKLFILRAYSAYIYQRNGVVTRIYMVLKMFKLDE